MIKLRKISRKEAEKEILDYLKKRDKAWTSRIADNLKLDVEFVNDILVGLESKGKIEGIERTNYLIR